MGTQRITWVKLANGKLLCVMRRNYNVYLGLSRSRDKGKTWSRVRPAISFLSASASAPSLFLTSDNILILATRIWGLFTSVDNGHTWSLPTDIGSYSTGDSKLMHEMPDGRLLLRRPATDAYQFITVDRQGAIHPAPIARKRQVVIFNGDGYAVATNANYDFQQWCELLFGPLENSRFNAFFLCDEVGGNTAAYDTQVLEWIGARSDQRWTYIDKWLSERINSPKVIVREAKKQGLDVI